MIHGRLKDQRHAIIGSLTLCCSHRAGWQKHIIILYNPDHLFDTNSAMFHVLAKGKVCKINFRAMTANLLELHGVNSDLFFHGFKLAVFCITYKDFCIQTYYTVTNL